MPGRYPKSFGLAAVEALWSGVPVVAADTAFLAPNIVAAGAGIAVDPRHTARFADVLRRITGDDPGVRAMSIAALERPGCLALSPEAWIDRLEATYRDRLEEAHAQSA